MLGWCLEGRWFVDGSSLGVNETPDGAVCLLACLLVVALTDKLHVLLAWSLLDLEDLRRCTSPVVVEFTCCDQVVDAIHQGDGVDFRHVIRNDQRSLSVSTKDFLWWEEIKPSVNGV